MAVVMQLGMQLRTHQLLYAFTLTKLEQYDDCYASKCCFVCKQDWVCVGVLLLLLFIGGHSFHIVLFSVLKQTHCTHVACDSELGTVFFLECVFLISMEVVY